MLNTHILIEYNKRLGESQYQSGCRIVYHLQSNDRLYFLTNEGTTIAPFGSSYYELLLDGSVGPCISYNYSSAD